MAIEEPSFKVISKTGTFEVRQYAPMLVAETTVEGDMDEASNRGFRRIADYIFGNNQSAQSGNAAKIAMTAPVTLEPQSEKIAMTVPVGIESSEQNKSAKIAMTAPVGIESAGNQWTVSFVMPSEYTLASLPKPLDPQVKIRELPAEKKAVITFSGFYNEEKVKEKTQALRDWMKSRNLKSTGEPQFARYNPPWTLPFMRRNEVLIQIQE